MRNDNLPVRINRLNDLAHNLWTSWHPQARILFQSLNYPAWRASGHNPVRELLETTPAQFEELSRDAEFLGIYDAAVEAFDKDMADGHFWFKKKYNDLLPGPIAYFAAEFAFHTSLPIYAGGLGVLTGDTVKEATDIGVPLVAVGLMYPQGYFHQRISPEGWQEETYEQLDFERSPIEQCPFPATCGPLVEVQFGDKSLFVGVWLAKVGRVNVYLLDTNVELNSPTDRQLSARLYAADREQRLQQELVLGVGGVRVLRTLGIQPVIWHGNEGHTSFMMLERVREEVEKGLSFKDAVQSVRTNSVFTTHTPVPAGHDVFSEALMEKYFRKFWTGMGIERTEFMKLGQYDGAAPSTFNMT
ncbi:MAG TPA: alpha-glucan family phosphorylase, partial [Dehalococcoidales bacterium]|nr:alpha-glucan family phosphorylase [Dehalococcoidales bacterium]